MGSEMCIRDRHKKHKVVVSSDEFEFLEDCQEFCEGQTHSASSHDFVQRLDAQADIQSMLSKLPEDMRMVLWLKEVEGYTHAEIAALVNKTPSYSKSLVSRALKFLRARLPVNEQVVVGAHEQP